MLLVGGESILVETLSLIFSTNVGSFMFNLSVKEIRSGRGSLPSID